jgi:hypothetical protein
MFESLFDDVRNRRKEFVVYRHGGPTDLEAQFATHNVRITCRTLPPGASTPFLVIREDGEFRGALSLADLEGLLTLPIVRPVEREDVSAGYRALFDVVDDTVFTSMARRELLAVSREIEDRVRRVGRGTFRVSFQALSIFESQLDVYRRLANETDLDIHIYGSDDWIPPEIAGITYHSDIDPSLEQYWVLVFDGEGKGGECDEGDEDDGGSVESGDDSGTGNSQTCALVAQERADGYRGFWTDDAAMVSRVLRTLEDG